MVIRFMDNPSTTSEQDTMAANPRRCVAASPTSLVRRAPHSWAMRTLAPTDNPETSVVAMKASNWPSPTAAMDVAPSPPTRNTAMMPSVRWSRVLTVTGKARVRTDFLICVTRDAMAGHPNRRPLSGLSRLFGLSGFSGSINETNQERPEKPNRPINQINLSCSSGPSCSAILVDKRVSVRLGSCSR